MATYENTPYLDGVLTADDVRKMVADHKTMFFIEKDRNGQAINYHRAVAGYLTLIPDSRGLAALETEYDAMTDVGILIRDALPFDEIMERCLRVQDKANNRPL